MIDTKSVRDFPGDFCIEDAELFLRYTFPDDYKDFIKQNHGCLLGKSLFECDGSDHFVGRLLAFDPKCVDMIHAISIFFGPYVGRYIAFAPCNSYDFLCFDTSNDKVVMWNHGTDCIVKVADTFSDFIKLLK